MRILTAVIPILLVTGSFVTPAAAAPVEPVTSEAVTAASAPRCNINKGRRLGQVTMIAFPAFQSGSYWTPNCVIPRGTSASFVSSLQFALRDCHKLNPGTIDGKYGPRTQAAVAALQRRVGIKDDGIYGPRTEDFMKWPVHNGDGRWWHYCDR